MSPPSLDEMWRGLFGDGTESSSPNAGKAYSLSPKVGQCDGTTAKRTRCTHAPWSWSFRAQHLRIAEYLIPHATTRCHSHMPPAEQNVIRRAQENREEMSDHALDGISPACWSWPLPDLRALDRLHSCESAALEALELWQAGRCAACGRVPGNGLVLDHDHETGMARGLLDRSCNHREAFWHRGTDDLLTRYRRRPPTVILGLSLRYRWPLTGELDMGTGPLADGSWDDNVLDGIGL